MNYTLEFRSSTSLSLIQIQSDVARVQSRVRGHLHDMPGVPNDRVGMEVLGRIEPEMKLLLPVALSLSVHIGMDRIWVPRQVAEELKVDLIVGRTLRRQLKAFGRRKSIVLTNGYS